MKGEERLASYVVKCTHTGPINFGLDLHAYSGDIFLFHIDDNSMVHDMF